MTERAAEDELVRMLLASGWDIARQVRLGGKHVDVVAQRNGLRMAVEVKLSDWRRAAAQAFLNGSHFDLTLIALPANPRRRIDYDLLDELHVGLIEFSDQGWELVRIPEEWRSVALAGGLQSA